MDLPQAPSNGGALPPPGPTAAEVRPLPLMDRTFVCACSSYVPDRALGSVVDSCGPTVNANES
jgi:hypothetical protein